MMKKLLVLVLVSVISTVASASVMSLQVDGSQTTANIAALNVGDVVWLKLNSSVFTDAMEFGLTAPVYGPKAFDDGWGGITYSVTGNAAFSSAQWVASTKTIALLDTDLNGVGPAGPGQTVDLVWNFYFEVTEAMAPGNYTVGLAVDSSSRYSVKPISAGGVWTSLTSGDVAGLNVTIVPEPMTVALLGLGGLLIRRKIC